MIGSYAKNQNNNLSDIDLIVEFEPDTEMLFEKKKILKAILRKRFSVEVDLCREKYIKKYYRKQILKSAIYVWKRFNCFAEYIDSANKIRNYIKGIKSADEFFEDEKSFDAVMIKLRWIFCNMWISF